ncbi:REP element-mobilizing transposase RayT [Prosthecobacter debontii]|uniref:REP element-mobilizing transposase RayT n=1 Tax=Prosthecobacter debontii TaxID=48467 RepID=A0A1T4YLP2_9BACT|nr:transposase [Prosthecobacter debontii]SKB02191.1 REP element-mobilizing transposase RayT [Prosthecobacter debontii]
MPQSLARVILHTVFSTKDRMPSFQNPSFRQEVHAYLGGCLKTLDSQPLIIGGVSDHVHLLATLPRTLCIADLVKEVKRSSTHWIQNQGQEFCNFHWQAGYGVFSVSESQLPPVTRYIEDQEAHHRGVTFQDEYRALLRKHGQKWDEAYVWD